MNSIDKQINIPEEFKKLSKDFSENGFITTSFDNLVNWSRTGSLHWYGFEWHEHYQNVHLYSSKMRTQMFERRRKVLKVVYKRYEITEIWL